MTFDRQHIATCSSEKDEEDMWLRSKPTVTGRKLAVGAFSRANHRNTPGTGSSRSNHLNHDERQYNAYEKTETKKERPNIGDETMIGKSRRLPEEKPAKTTLTKPPLARVEARTPGVMAVVDPANQ
ncbi:hypothetical protein F2Q68_00029442 [Brassica cretica]|uniref:Uncharacterized protein n=1 Tax=Brassica cretica TaxID=69181 RepID=A0A8S9GFP2_BRACR|nr:hypothetical protein F2Q68_00029442 [Brassica cretica]